MAKLTTLQTSDDVLRKDARQLLMDALGEDFRQVVVVGIKDDGKHTVLLSRGMDVLKAMGACMRAALFIDDMAS